MLSLGLLLEREQIVAALRRRVLLAAALFAVIVPVPALAVIVVKSFRTAGRRRGWHRAAGDRAGRPCATPGWRCSSRRAMTLRRM